MAHDPEEAAEAAFEAVSAIGDDTERFTAEESLDFYQSIENLARTSARAIQEDLDREGN